MNEVSAMNEVTGIEELSEKQLDEVSGGCQWCAIAAGVWAGAQIVKAVYDFGYSVGRHW
jgi:bacteriocin-like protein